MTRIAHTDIIIGNTIRVLRAHRNMTQINVAMRLGIPRETLSALEHGRQSLSIHQLARLVRIFKLRTAGPILAALDYARTHPNPTPTSRTGPKPTKILSSQELC